MSPGIPTRLLATQSDERLLALVRDGHERAFEAIVKRYRRPLLGYCRRLSLSETRAEDTVQLALLKTWVAVREGAEVRDLKAWLYRVVHNTAINCLRDCARDGEPLADPASPVSADGEESPLERRLRMREALAEVAALPPLQREVIVRTAVAGHSHEQVATDLGLSNGAVRGLLYRARLTLRAAITMLTPAPLLSWLMGRSEQGGPSPERLTELAAGAGAAGGAAGVGGGLGAGGGAGVGGLLLKGGVALIAAGTMATGAAIVHLGANARRGARTARTFAQAPPGGSGAGALASGAGADRDGARIDGNRALESSPARRRRHSGAAARNGARPPGAESGRSGEGAAPRSGGGAHRHTRVGAASPQASKPTPGSDGAAQPGGAGAGTEGGAAQGTGANGSGAGSSGGPESGAGASPGSASGSSAPSGSGAGGSSGSGASGGGSSGAGSSSTSGSGTESGSGSASGSGSGSGVGSGAGGSSGTGSGGTESSGQATSEGSGGSESSGGEHPGSLVGTVVHEVDNLVEHLLH